MPDQKGVLVTDDQPKDWLDFDGMTWPDPRDPAEVQWRLRYGTPTEADRMWCASVLGAYRQLVDDPRRTRDAKVAGIRRAMR